MIFIGVDPGLKGAIALIDDDNAFVTDMPLCLGPIDRLRMVDTIAIREWVMDLIWSNASDICGADDIYVMIESPQWRKGLSAQSVCTTWFNFGRLTTAAVFHGWVPVEAALWKHAMGVTKDKATSIALARELFPAVAHELTDSKDGRSEALLIAEYARRIHR